ncbi:ADP-ribosylglycohydrolase family protein [Aureispira sp. CCB-E]|uniref:ADP-ribosylglycohydrolase family protein n=1 Tax=Aureispira sp. CCB-E TaxID=3051121 RepID=UPI002868FAD9|nr:ADP-ribosylglycohydrolase family protein [Aureispira sp. CCB-E]WMX12457.1 ADP-ribosylglycohydrolase family protein [Aureispira sp. CCB-E]
MNRLKLAKKSLKGLSIGDAFGESFFGESFFGERAFVLSKIAQREIPTTTWEFTDDTVMAIAIVEQLKRHESIVPNELIQLFVENHDKDPNRGYGATARRILREVGEGGDWRKITTAVFDGMGSMGNGAAMRVAPIGAYYYDDFEKIKMLTFDASKVTHANIEAKAGALAVALGAALATQIKLHQISLNPHEFINQILAHLPDTDTRSKIKKSLSVPYSYHIDTVKTILGNGSKIMTQDTVPFTIWCAAHNLEHFENALWKAVSILGDRDTIGAIVGSITILSSKEENIPKKWVCAVEDFETSIFWNGQNE